MTYDPRQQPPQQQPPQYPPYQPLYPPAQWPREAVSVRGDIGQPEKIAWAVAIMCTAGLALPFYWARKRSARRRTVTRYR